MTPENATKTPLYAVYLHRLYSLAVSVREGCDDVFRLTPPPGAGMYIKVDPALHARLDGILIDAANIKRLVATNPQRGKRESKRAYDLRLARSRALAKLVSSCDLSHLLDVRVRNSLEHFDEYLDDLNAKLTAGNMASSPMAAYNMTLSHWEVTAPRVYPLRLYISGERKYYNFGNVIDLSALREQSATLADTLLASGLLGSANEPGGLMVRMPHQESSGGAA